MGLAHAAQEFTTLDWTVIPGQRVGPITAATSERKLRQIFGDQNVRPENIDIGEGDTEPGTVIFPDDPDKRLAVLWTDKERRDKPKEIRIVGNKSMWKTDKGISLGTTLKELERLNGRPFRIMGFAWDYSGTIVDCNSGHLKELGCTDPKDAKQISRGRTLLLRLLPEKWVDEMEDSNKKDFETVSGEQIFNSHHPAMQRLNPRVYEMIIFFTPQDI